MANVIKRERQIAILKLLAEGNSIRSVVRLTGIHKSTVMRFMVRFGNDCRDFLDLALCNLSLEHVELDEIWTFVRKKQKELQGWEIVDPEIGDIYLFTALDQKTKLLAAYRIGKRNHQTTQAMIADLESRMVRPPVTEGERPQLSTDGWASYVPTIRDTFGGSVKHGILIKQYRNPESGCYAPPALTGTERIAVQNIADVTTICTSHVERCNGTIRQWCKRFTRLTYAFSKKLENLGAAVAIHVAVYNFVRIHGSLKMTPAMAAGVIDKHWKMDDLYDAVMQQAERKRKAAKINRLIAKLREQK